MISTCRRKKQPQAAAVRKEAAGGQRGEQVDKNWDSEDRGFHHGDNIWVLLSEISQYNPVLNHSTLVVLMMIWNGGFLQKRNDMNSV